MRTLSSTIKIVFSPNLNRYDFHPSVFFLWASAQNLHARFFDSEILFLFILNAQKKEKKTQNVCSMNPYEDFCKSAWRDRSKNLVKPSKE